MRVRTTGREASPSRSLLRLFGPLLFCLSTGCASTSDKDMMTGAKGLATDVVCVVELGKRPPDEASFLAGVDRAVAQALDERRGEVTDHALARFETGRTEDQTHVALAQVEVLRESPTTRAEEDSSTRKPGANRTAHFRFTLRRAPARLALDPDRVETPLVCIEDSRAPGDTLTFPQDFRAELRDTISKVVYELARSSGLEPVAPRPSPVQ